MRLERVDNVFGGNFWPYSSHNRSVQAFFHDAMCDLDVVFISSVYLFTGRAHRDIIMHRYCVTRIYIGDSTGIKDVFVIFPKKN